MAVSVEDQLTQLESARQIILGDSALYPQIVQGILPIVGVNARLELRRWGAEFLAETFASPAVGLQQKEHMSLIVLQTLRLLLENPQEDMDVVKNVVQAAASIYGYTFRYILNSPHDSTTWGNMAAIKSNILKRWDTAAMGVRICCIKFVQKVVQLQTPGMIADPRRPEQNELSLALVPRDHPLIPPPKLEPEASGLLDRLLDVFIEQPSNPVLITATLNCIGPLIRTRPSVAGKIISSLTAFNPFKQAGPHMSTKVKLQARSMERTMRMLLLNTLRRQENGPFGGRIKQYLDKITQARLEIFDEGRNKRPHPTEPTDGLESAKRARLGAEMPSRPQPPPLPPGPVSIAQLFTLTPDPGLTGFDVTQLPIDLVVKITLPVLHRIDLSHLQEAINHVRSRYLFLSQKPPLPLQGLPVNTSDTQQEEEDYEPDFQPTEDPEQIRNKNDVLPPEDVLRTPTELALGPFKLPQPPPLTAEETEQISKGTINRVFGMMNVLDEPSTAKRQKPGLNRLAGSSYDREAWITVITRLATRASAGLEDDHAHEGQEKSQALATRNASPSLAEGIRETLWKYIIEDFRARIPIAISWLNEEWYNDRLHAQSRSTHPNIGVSNLPEQQHYEKWVLKVLDGILPYLEPKDKVLIRFLSEIPAVDQKILERVKSLAKDPERVGLAVNAIHYLILVRPPVRDLCIDALEDLWRNYEDARHPTTKLLTKWRPHILEEARPSPEPSPTPSAPTNGIKSPDVGEQKTEEGPNGFEAGNGGGNVVAAVG